MFAMLLGWVWGLASGGQGGCITIHWTLAGLTSFIIILTITRIIQVIMFMKLLVIVRILKIQSFEINFI